jgi:hypothetical protein
MRHRRRDAFVDHAALGKTIKAEGSRDLVWFSACNSRGEAVT